MRVVKYSFIGFLFFVLFGFTQTTFAQQPDPYVPFAEEMPQPVGGAPAIYKNIKYPNMAKQAGIQGKVYVLIYINERGGVDDVKIVKGIGGGCDEAAIAGVKETKFSPAKNGGKPVKAKLSMAIEFKLSG